MKAFTHFDPDGTARMVDVGAKPATDRFARASARIQMKPETLQAIQNRATPKGSVLETARLAGIMAAKHTAELIPLCHSVVLDSVQVDLTPLDDRTIGIEARARCTGKTGVEMEALTAAVVAALTIYDMCKAADRTMEIQSVRLEEKSGGQSGHFLRPTPADSPGPTTGTPE